MIWPLGPRRPLAIDPKAWQRIESDLPWLRALSDPERQRLRELMAGFLSEKTFTGVHGLEIDDTMRLRIAAQACLPVLHLGLAPYSDFVEIVVYPAAFAVQRRVTDEDGIVHEYEDALAGEAMERGPVVLSWSDVVDVDPDAPIDVVIHEFAHKLDMSDGDADGVPPMPASRRARWRAVLHDAYESFVRQVDAVEASLPPDVDPEDEAADAWYAGLPLDPYAATDVAEFFAVSAEAYFVDPAPLEQAFPEYHAMLAAYFRPGAAARA